MLNSESGRRHCALDLESGEHAMHSTPRPDTFNNFLPDVATLVEIQCAVRTGFLRQILLSDIDAEFRNATGNAKKVECLTLNLLCTGFEQGIPKSRRSIDPRDLITRDTGIVATNQP